MPKKVSLIISHWYHLVDGLNESPQKFYTSLEKSIAQHKIQNLKLSRVDYQEGGLFSAKREYFRIQRKEHIFDICAAPFGKGFFVSWWLGESMGFLWSLIIMIPFFGEYIIRIFQPQTYYRHDTALMFQSSIHSAVLEVMDKITKAKGVRNLSELERKPILSSFFNK